ncbi:MAG: hypothetical protein ABI222_10665 [Opitutaceae bacterium]
MTAPVASLDIFDTVLTRRVGAPAAVFYFVGRTARARGLTALAPEAFASERYAAQKAARLRVTSREVSLELIHRELAERLSLPPDKGAALHALELAAEAEFICAVPGVHAWLATVRARSPRVIFTSDMYLPSDFLRARLIEHGCWQEGDGLYVSGEHGGSKRSGALFHTILAKEKLAPAHLHHIGNHAESDFAVPQRLGLTATHRADANPNRYEEDLETFSAATSGLASLHAGASRLARLATAASTAHAESIREVAAGVAGPVLSSYVRWLLTAARRRGIVRLYFVSRDGHLLLQLARQFAPQLHPDVELRYLHGSRRAWHLPAITSLDTAELAGVFDGADFLSVTSLGERVGLSADEIPNSLAPTTIPSADWDLNLSARDRIQLRAALQNPSVKTAVEQRAAAAREVLLAYLQQEKLLSPDRCALVDVGWHGRAQDSLARVIRSAGFPAPEGFYFGLNSSSGVPDLGERHAWFFDRRSELRPANAFPGIEPLIETFCTADHGLTIGYARTATGVRAVLDSPPTELIPWGWSTLSAAITAYGQALAVAPAVEADGDAVRAMCLSALKLFWQTPTLAEAAAWGAFPYEDAQTGATPQPLASALRWSQSAKILLHGRTGPHRAAWWHGSLQLTPPLRRSALAIAHSVRRAAKSFKQ